MRRDKYKYWLTKEGLIQIEGWAKDGLSDEQIAHNIGIDRTTIYSWKKKYTAIADALKKGKEVIDRQVENALLKRALGYEYEEETAQISESGKKTFKRIKKHIPADVTAAIFWLKNRKYKQWRDVNKIEIDKPVQVEQSTTIDFSCLSKEELLKLTREAFKNE